ncbi:hypothetical protein SAMN05880582_1011690 [Rhizobium sp. RU20A]|uniref:sulfite exporter TauE/SafE family protein n=1 Tax=Rhizobium sp. RU20A TaxID=1907412 RepID=UPI0009572C7C|nr:sulfite exporter TauE/SafE family protein [Rhizobium sp. RU20A]SIQ38830.1 hypothetical protein SAMN05880582_1011690 [Rhizobium sp. RU20A]
MSNDLTFYLVAAIAVLFVGMAKGGMGEALALMGVPILSLVTSPVEAAALLLPILIVMDGVSLWAWRRDNDRRTLLMMLPGALVGIAIGWITAAQVPRDALRLIIGAITVGFVLRYAFTLWRARQGVQAKARGHSWPLAALLGLGAGYGSFVAHSGGPFFQIYGLPLRLPPRAYTGAIVRFFAILNVVKILPYAALGQLNTTNLTTSVTLFPLAALATFTGSLIVKRMKPSIFYPFMYIMAFIAGLKLLMDGFLAMTLISGT